MSDREDRPTVTLDPRTITGPSWPITIANLELLSPQGVIALRLGVLTLVRNITQRMAEPGAGPGLVGELQYWVDVLRHLPWEGK